MTYMPNITEAKLVRTSSLSTERKRIAREGRPAAAGATLDPDKTIIVLALTLLVACTVLVAASTARSPEPGLSLDDDLPRYTAGA